MDNKHKDESWEDLDIDFSMIPMENDFASLENGKYELNDEQNTSAYTFNLKIKVTDDKGSKTIAYVKGYICGANYDDAMIVDELTDTDTTNGMYAILDAFGEDGLEYIECDYICYIHNLYVVPEARGKGIATFLFNNLPGIAYNNYDINIRGISILPKVSTVNIDKNDEIIAETITDELNEEQTAMQKHMEKVVEDCGYIPDNPDAVTYYVKIFDEDIKQYIELDKAYNDEYNEKEDDE